MSLSQEMKGFKYEPALILYGVNAGIAVAIAFGLNWTPTQSAAATVAVTAVLGIITALLTRPVSVSVIVAAFTSGLVALGAFGLHLGTPAVSSLAALLSVLLGVLLRVHVSPVAVQRAPVRRAVQ